MLHILLPTHLSRPQVASFTPFSFCDDQFGRSERASKKKIKNWARPSRDRTTMAKARSVLSSVLTLSQLSRGATASPDPLIPGLPATRPRLCAPSLIKVFLFHFLFALVLEKKETLDLDMRAHFSSIPIAIIICVAAGVIKMEDF